MPPTILLASLLVQSPVLDAPTYTANSIVNTASGLAGSYAPNTFITITGTNLAFVTRAITTGDISAGILPTALPGTGVEVIINGVLADIYSVAPTAVLCLIPTLLTAGPATIQLEADGLAGQPVQVTLGASAPAMFQRDAVTVLATHGDYSAVSSTAPAEIGEEIAIWATGLGATIPSAIPNQLPTTDAPLADAQHFVVMLDGVAVPTRLIDYVGANEGYAGLFQINITIPAGTGANPQIQVGTNNGAVSVMSPPGRILPVDPSSHARPIGKPIPHRPRIIM